MPKRCSWCGTDALYVAYHDEEWGVPLHDDRELFAMLILEGAQAGLSWSTILKRRDGYRAAFANFDAQEVANYNQNKIESLLLDPGIIRNRLKVKSAVTNAVAFLELQKEFGSFDHYIWSKKQGWMQPALPGGSRPSQIYLSLEANMSKIEGNGKATHNLSPRTWLGRLFYPARLCPRIPLLSPDPYLHLG